LKKRNNFVVVCVQSNEGKRKRMNENKREEEEGAGTEGVDHRIKIY